jgi:quercetin dioxygenase-like cupin family protein
MGAAIDVLVEPGGADADQLAVIRVTIPAGASLPPHDHGESEAVLIPLAGELLVSAAGGRVERLQAGGLAVISAHERVSVQNPGREPASMLVCMAPPTFVEALRRQPVGTQAGASC